MLHVSSNLQYYLIVRQLCDCFSQVIQGDSRAAAIFVPRFFLARTLCQSARMMYPSNKLGLNEVLSGIGFGANAFDPFMRNVTVVLN